VLPTQAQVVICGTGVVANSLAYHLVEYGWSDIVLIDQGKYVHPFSFNTILNIFYIRVSDLYLGRVEERHILVLELLVYLNQSLNAILLCIALNYTDSWKLKDMI